MVAWFTASRAFTMKAGTFAVVNTKDNLAAELTAGVGNTVTGVKRDTITTKDAHALTDASFDHTATTENVIIAPNSDGEEIGQIIPVGSAVDAAVGATYSLKRENAAGDNPNVYTAFTWDITFRLSFSSSASLPVGLFLNLAVDSGTWAHEACTPKADDHTDNGPTGDWYTNPDLSGAVFTPTAAGYYKHVATTDTEPVGGWFTDVDCTASATGTYLTKGTTYYKPGLPSGATYYKAAPDNTGMGFRIAFVPKAIPTGSLGLTKIWAPHRNETGEDTQPNFIDIDKGGALAAFNAETNYAIGDKVIYQDKVYSCKTPGVSAWDVANWDAASVTLASKTETYEMGTATTKLVNGARGSQTIGAGKAVMVKGDNTGVPDSSTIDADDALSETNFLGYFGADAGNTVALTYTCVAYYEGTDPMIVNTKDTIYETLTTSLEFGVSTLTAVPS